MAESLWELEESSDLVEKEEDSELIKLEESGDVVDAVGGLNMLMGMHVK